MSIPTRPQYWKQSPNKQMAAMAQEDIPGFVQTARTAYRLTIRVKDFDTLEEFTNDFDLSGFSDAIDLLSCAASL
jgi:hypothetical protein